MSFIYPLNLHPFRKTTMPILPSRVASEHSRAGQRSSVATVARRLGALAILCASALDANAICLSYGPSDFASATALAGGGFSYSGGGAAFTTTCGASSGLSSQSITDFYMPYFADMSIANIGQGAGWTHDVEATNDLFGVHGGVVHFALSTPGAFAPFTFTYTAGFAPISAASLIVGVDANGKSTSTVISAGAWQPFGDQFFMPGSPDAVAGFAAAVPEPSSAAMLAAGLALIGFAASRRKHVPQESVQHC